MLRMAKVMAAAAALLLGLGLAGAPALAAKANEADARQFLETFYAGYANPDFCPLCEKKFKLFDASLVTLIKTDRRLTPKDELGPLDFDPMCDCQDPEGLKAVIGEVRMTSPSTAAAEVEVRFGPTIRRLSYALVFERNQWRIHDVSGDSGSMRQILTQANAERAGKRR